MNAKLYIDGKLIMETSPLEYPKLVAVSCTLTEYPTIVRREDRYYSAKFSGEVWRVCGVDWCYIDIFPTKESAEHFIKQPTMYGGYSFGDRDNRRKLNDAN